MAIVADLNALVSEGVLTRAQADILRGRSRAAMIAMVIHTLLAGGVLAAAGGLVALLAAPVPVAMAGCAFLAFGVLVLVAGGDLWRMFGHAAALIGAGMLIGGGVTEAMDSLTEASAGMLFLAVGLLIAGICGLCYQFGPPSMRFLTGFLLVAGVALHLAGLFILGIAHDAGGAPRVMANLYTTVALIALGWYLDTRLLTALAIVPFAQMLDTSTAYFHAAYVFYSPEPTFSILQVALAMAIAVALMQARPERDGRHAGIFAIMAFVVGNLCFLVGSLWGDVPGQSLLMTSVFDRYPDDWQARNAAIDAFIRTAVQIPDYVFAIVWAALLAACAIWAAHTLRRGLFNAAMTFGAIHAYTQAFESFGDEPMAWVIGGLAAIPLAWGIWRLNEQFR